MTQGDIHRLDSSLENIQTQIRQEPEISDRDKDLLVNGTEEAPSYLSYMRSKGHSISRILRYMRTAYRMFKNENWSIEEVDKAKLTRYVGKLQTDEICKKNGEPFASSTKREIKKGIRKLYVDYADSYQDELNFSEGFDAEEIINFKLGGSRSYTDPERLPTPKTVKELVENCKRPRNKAYIMLLWSTGGRNGEILGLKWRDVKFTGKIGKVVFKDTKNGGDHKVPMAEAYPFMFQHRENDPKSSDPNAFVFRSLNSGNQLSASTAGKITKRLREKDEVNIPSQIKTNPHAFRKGRTSYWARQEKNEAWICRHMNWAQGNNTVRHYCRMAQEDVERGVAESLGLERSQDKEKREESTVLTPSECHSCGAINGFETENCFECGETLETSKLYKEAKVKEMKEEIKSEMIEKNVGKTREEIRDLAKKAVDGEVVEQ